MFKIVLQGGSFALTVVFVLWVLFKGEPKYREMIEKIEGKHESAIQRITDTFKMTVDSILKSHELIVAQITKECREERREWGDMVRKEGELNRKNRHDTINQIQDLVARAYSEGKDRAQDGGSGLHKPI